MCRTCLDADIATVYLYLGGTLNLGLNWSYVGLNLHPSKISSHNALPFRNSDIASSELENAALGLDDV